MSKKNKIHFLAGSVPSGNISGVIAIMNWANKNDFEIAEISNVLMMSTRRIVGQAGPSMESNSFFYCATTKEFFEKYFGEPYDENKITEYVKKIGEIEGTKNELIES